MKFEFGSFILAKYEDKCTVSHLDAYPNIIHDYYKALVQFWDNLVYLQGLTVPFWLRFRANCGVCNRSRRTREQYIDQENRLVGKRRQKERDLFI